MKVIFDFDYSIEVVDKKLYDKLEEKHEADSRLISEYDLEIKKLERVWVKRYNELEYMYEKKDAENNRIEDRYRIHIADLKSRLFDLKNTENERDHYKGLYSSKCDDYDTLLAKRIKTEKEAANYKELFHSLNHKHQKVVGEMKAWKERAMEAEKKLKETEEKYNDACVLNKMREDVFVANINLQKTIEAKDREIGLLRAELDKYKTDDRWID